MFTFVYKNKKYYTKKWKSKEKIYNCLQWNCSGEAFLIVRIFSQNVIYVNLANIAEKWQVEDQICFSCRETQSKQQTAQQASKQTFEKKTKSEKINIFAIALKWI